MTVPQGSRERGREGEGGREGEREGRVHCHGCLINGNGNENWKASDCS